MLLARTSSEELYTHHKASFLRWDNDPDNPVSMVRVGQPGESLAVGGREKKPLVCLFAFIVGLYVVVATYFLFAVEMIPCTEYMSERSMTLVNSSVTGSCSKEGIIDYLQESGTPFP